MLKRMKRRVGIKIDMTPMVDVAFLLLIFYMTTTQFKPPEKKQISIPASHSNIKVPDYDLLNITVTKDDSIFVDYIAKKEELVAGKKVSSTDRVYQEASVNTINQVIGQILMQSAAGGVRLRLVIKADRDVAYGTMQSLMDALMEMKVTQFNLITELKTD